MAPWARGRPPPAAGARWRSGGQARRGTRSRLGRRGPLRVCHETAHLHRARSKLHTITAVTERIQMDIGAFMTVSPRALYLAGPAHGGRARPTADERRPRRAQREAVPLACVRGTTASRGVGRLGRGQGLWRSDRHSLSEKLSQVSPTILGRPCFTRPSSPSAERTPSTWKNPCACARPSILTVSTVSQQEPAFNTKTSMSFSARNG